MKRVYVHDFVYGYCSVLFGFQFHTIIIITISFTPLKIKPENKYVNIKYYINICMGVNNDSYSVVCHQSFIRSTKFKAKQHHTKLIYWSIMIQIFFSGTIQIHVAHHVSSFKRFWHFFLIRHFSTIQIQAINRICIRSNQKSNKNNKIL